MILLCNSISETYFSLLYSPYKQIYIINDRYAYGISNSYSEEKKTA